MEPHLVIKPSLHYAAVQGEGILMDVVENRYVALTATSARIWTALAEGQGVEQIAQLLGDDAAREADLRALVTRQLEAWSRAGLVSAEPEEGANLPRARGPETCAERELGREGLAGVPLSLAWLVRLVLARRAWSRRLRGRGLAPTLARLQQIPVRSVERARLEPTLLRSIRAYTFARRLFAQGQSDCLDRSLALAAILRRSGIDAQICFGVCKFPFRAHAWVEAERMVLNETLEAIRVYTPIARF